ncbi:MAG: GAF and ANTAR domain-containing protein [Marmoricola sp.]
MERAASLTRRIAEVARALQDETGSVDTMDLAVKLALEIVENGEEASISVVHRDRIVETPAFTGEQSASVDRIQYELKEGPLLTGIWDEDVISVPDLTTEHRWPAWTRRTVAETGVRSMLCFRMYAGRSRVGALSVYSSRPHAFNGVDVEAGISFAAHTAVAIEVAQQDEHKDLAMDSRSLIGQATGIVMERYEIDAVRAFATLRRISQHSNVKIHEVAAELIRTRDMPV